MDGLFPAIGEGKIVAEKRRAKVRMTRLRPDERMPHWRKERRWRRNAQAVSRKAGIESAGTPTLPRRCRGKRFLVSGNLAPPKA
jgi:hypothetical protein